MSTGVFLAVLGAAVMHATWNALIRVGLDRIGTVLRMALVQCALALPLAFVFPLPAAEASAR